MRCPECKSENIAKGLKSPISGKIAVCYSCGFTDVISAFLENGDVLSDDAIETFTSNIHPLLNPESKHYNMFDGKEAIEILESIMTTVELKAWCRGNIYKYRLRLGNKDDVSKEIKKIQTYEAYYEYLENKV